MRKVLKPEFFNRNSVVVAKDLIGKYLVREINGKKVSNKILEVEAYEGSEDKASHAHKGKTPRNNPMFGKPGTIYVYFTYGMHFMLNITCGNEGHPAAILVRSIEDCIGPGKLTKKLQIDKMLNGQVLGKKSGLWIEEKQSIIKGREKLRIISTPRIGVDSSGPIWSKKLYRFLLQPEIKNKIKNAKQNEK